MDGDEKKKLFLVAPINAPSKDSVKISDTTEMMRNMEVNNRKQGNIRLIDTLFSRVDDDIYVDDLYLNQIGTTRLVKEMDNRIGGLMREERVTTGRIYSKVETGYMWGCSFCCKEEHDDEKERFISHHLKVVKINQKKVKSRLNFCFSTTPCCVSDKTLTQ